MDIPEAGLCCVLLSAVFSIQTTFAGTTPPEFSKLNAVTHYTLSENAEVLIHNLGEHQLVEFFISSESSNVTVHDLRIKGLLLRLTRKSLPRKPLQ